MKWTGGGTPTQECTSHDPSNEFRDLQRMIPSFSGIYWSIGGLADTFICNVDHNLFLSRLAM